MSYVLLLNTIADTVQDGVIYVRLEIADAAADTDVLVERLGPLL
jgi:hypothetical protein